MGANLLREGVTKIKGVPNSKDKVKKRIIKLKISWKGYIAI